MPGATIRELKRFNYDLFLRPCPVRRWRHLGQHLGARFRCRSIDIESIDVGCGPRMAKNMSRLAAFSGSKQAVALEKLRSGEKPCVKCRRGLLHVFRGKRKATGFDSVPHMQLFSPRLLQPRSFRRVVAARLISGLRPSR